MKPGTPTLICKSTFISASLLLLSSCNISQDRKLNIHAVMDRTIDTIVDVTNEMEAVKQNKETPAVMQAFMSRLHSSLNSRPRVLNNGVLGIVIKNNASLVGFDDLNKNNIQEDGEQHLFTLEIDQQTERLIATDFADNTYGTLFRNGQYRGFFFDWTKRVQINASVDQERFVGKKIETKMKSLRQDPKSKWLKRD